MILNSYFRIAQIEAVFPGPLIKDLRAMQSRSPSKPDSSPNHSSQDGSLCNFLRFLRNFRRFSSSFLSDQGGEASMIVQFVQPTYNGAVSQFNRELLLEMAVKLHPCPMNFASLRRVLKDWNQIVICPGKSGHGIPQ